MTEQNGVERSSATEVLRRMLDERGVEHDDFPDVTLWNDSDGVSYTAFEIYTRGNKKPSTKRLMLRRTVTPEQAIAATLGRGECKLPETRSDHGIIEYNGVTEWRRCSACGAEVLSYPARFCPNCGAKAVDE